MALFRRRLAYDRARILDLAARARARGRRRRAIDLYRQVLFVEPRNGELHAKLAPLLADTGQEFDAWQSYRGVARACLRDGHTEKALALYREAASRLPRQVEAWEAAARLLHRSGRHAEAIETLHDGSRKFRSRRLRPQAIHLLRRARELDAWHFEIVRDLAKLLDATRQRAEAGRLLEGLAEHTEGTLLRRVRSAQFQRAPGVASFWRWLRQTIRPGAPTPPAPLSPVVPLHTARRR
ncbi:MAG: tetratricopeptide repeat protein [Myxococcota bacterium]|nr:tetratricopeptide repeat protein [Myxococcota bacterium]